MNPRKHHRIHGCTLAVLGLAWAWPSTGCTNDDGQAPTFILRASVAPGEPPENEDIGLLVNVQAAIFHEEPEASQRGLVEVHTVGGTLALPGQETRGARRCFYVPASTGSVADAPTHPVLTYPEGRSSRVFALLWSAAVLDDALEDDGCPSDLSSRVVLDSTALLVPPDESEPDAATTAGGDTEASTTGGESASTTHAGETETTTGSSETGGSSSSSTDSGFMGGGT